MTQTIATIDMITKESQLVLHEALSFIPTINRSFDDSFGKTGAKSVTPCVFACQLEPLFVPVAQ